MIGQTISHYRVSEKIGQGGMGEIYLALDTVLKRRVALKFLPESLLLDETARLRFAREAQSAAALDHPYICHINEVGRHEGRDFIAMEYVEGQSLKDRLAEGPLLLREALKLAAEVSEALEEAHSKGIVHRDLKPANIMLTKGGHPKVMDFGLAKRVGRGDGTEMELTAALTREGSTLGTLTYMSPEQLRGHEVDTRSDLFSFGIILYELLTGVHPFRRETAVDTSGAILADDPAPLEKYCKDVPELLEHAVRKLLAKDAGRRYQSIREVRTDLEQLVEDSGRSGIHSGSKGALVRKFRGIVAAGLALVVMAAALLIWAPWEEPELPSEEKAKQTVLLADFDTGDPAFDQLLEDTVRRAFADSASVGMVAEAGERYILTGMVKPPDSRFTIEIAREACERVGRDGHMKAVVSGSVHSLGEASEVVLRADNCRGGQLALEQRRAASMETVVAALAEASNALVAQLETVLPSVEGPEGLVYSVRTPSIEALRLYTESWANNKAGKVPEASALLERAVDYDPDFAGAHLILALLQNGRGKLSQAREHAVRAWECRQREEGSHEIYAIEIVYYALVRLDLEKAIETARMVVQRNPSSIYRWQQLAYALSQLGRLEEGLESFKESSRLSSSEFPAESFPGYLLLDRLPEAKADLERLLAQGYFLSEAHRGLWQIAFLGGDLEAMRREAEWIAAHPDEDGMFEVRMHEAFYQGRFQDGRQLLDDWVVLLRQQDREELVEQVLLEQAWVEVLFGNEDVGREYLAPTIDARAAHPDLTVRAAYTMALLGEGAWVDGALETALELYPEATLLNNLHAPTLEAILNWKGGDADSALGRLRTVARYEQAPEADKFKLVRGQMLLEANRADEAAEAFRLILDHPGQIIILAPWRPFGPVFSWIEIPVARVGLARALALGGDMAGARKAYEDFFELWTDADPDIPLLRQARAEYAGLR